MRLIEKKYDSNSYVKAKSYIQRNLDENIKFLDIPLKQKFFDISENNFSYVLCRTFSEDFGNWKILGYGEKYFTNKLKQNNAYCYGDELCNKMISSDIYQV